MTDQIPVPGRYRHFKGSEYEVLDIGRHSETEEVLAIYVSVDEPDCIWVRPAAMFSEQVESDGRRRPRFELTDPRARHLTARASSWFTQLRSRLGFKGRSHALSR